jgi:hypothetical protein
MKRSLSKDMVRVTLHMREDIKPKMIIPRGKPQYLKQWISRKYYKKIFGFFFFIREYKTNL